MASPDKKPSQDLDDFIFGRKNSTERHGPEYIRTAVTVNPGTALLGFIWDKLRTVEHKYQEQRQSAPHEFNPELGRKWFWIIVVTGLVLPFTSLIGLELRQTKEAGTAFSDLLTMIFAMSILFVAPFLAYAIHSKKRLRGDRSQLRPVIGGFVGVSAVYAFFYVVFLPWGVSLGSSDYAGMAQAMTVYFLFIVPGFGLGALALGRKLSPPRPGFWVSGQLHGVSPDPKSKGDPIAPDV